MSATLIAQYLLAGLVIGVLYALMAVGITFIYSIMKMINWAMGEFFMIGSYAQYFLLVGFVGPSRWYAALPIVLLGAGLLGVALVPGPVDRHVRSHVGPAAAQVGEKQQS